MIRITDKLTFPHGSNHNPKGVCHFDVATYVYLPFQVTYWWFTEAQQYFEDILLEGSYSRIFFAK